MVRFCIWHPGIRTPSQELLYRGQGVPIQQMPSTTLIPFFFLPYWYTDPSKERKAGRESRRCGVEVFRTCVAILYYCFGPVLFFLVARTRMAREVAG